jgi:hypothetical protein
MSNVEKAKIPDYVIFDLDETLGYFTELSIIWGCLQSVYNASGQNTFNKLCEVFEKDYFRPGIFRVFKFLKKQGNNVKVILYTNNTGQIEWLTMILKYIEMRAGVSNLFHKIVPGFKRGDPPGPHKRTSFEKTYSEIIRCASIPNNARIIFFDDLWHPKMHTKQVSYVHVRPFFHPLRPAFIIHKLQHSYFQFLDYSTNSYLYRCIKNFHKQYVDRGHHHKTSRIDDQDIITPIKQFLRVQKKTVRRRKSKSHNKTKKHNH